MKVKVHSINMLPVHSLIILIHFYVPIDHTHERNIQSHELSVIKYNNNSKFYLTGCEILYLH